MRQKNYELEAIVSRVVKTIGFLFPAGSVDVRQDRGMPGWYELTVRTRHPGLGEWCTVYCIRPEELGLHRDGYAEYLMEHIPHRHMRGLIHVAAERADRERFSGDWDNRQARW